MVLKVYLKIQFKYLDRDVLFDYSITKYHKGRSFMFCPGKQGVSVTLFEAPLAADRVKLPGPPPTQPALTDSSADALAINKTFPAAALNRRTYHKRDFKFVFVRASGLACMRTYCRETCEGLCVWPCVRGYVCVCVRA